MPNVKKTFFKHTSRHWSLSLITSSVKYLAYFLHKLKRSEMLLVLPITWACHFFSHSSQSSFSIENLQFLLFIFVLIEHCHFRISPFQPKTKFKIEDLIWNIFQCPTRRQVWAGEAMSPGKTFIIIFWTRKIRKEAHSTMFFYSQKKILPPLIRKFTSLGILLRLRACRVHRFLRIDQRK